MPLALGKAGFGRLPALPSSVLSRVGAESKLVLLQDGSSGGN